MIFRQLQVSTLVFSFTVLYYKKKLSEKWVLLRFEQKLFAKQENARDRRQLPVGEHNFPTCSSNLFPNPSYEIFGSPDLNRVYLQTDKR